MAEILTEKKQGRPGAGQVVLAIGVLAGVAWWLSRRKEEDSSLMTWIKATNPGLSEAEYQSLEAYWLTHAKIVAAQQAEVDANLPAAASDAADTEAAASSAATVAIQKPTDAEAQAAAAAAAAEAEAARQAYIAGLNTTLATYEAAWNEAQSRLATAEANYASTLKAYSELADYVIWRFNRVGKEVFVWTGKNLSGQGWGLPWGDYPNVSVVGIPNDSIKSVKVIKGAKVTFYWHSDFGGTSWEYDAAEGNLEIPDMGNFNGQASSMYVKPSLRAYERERDAAHAAFNTCYTALVGMQGEILTLQTGVLSLSRDIGIVTYFNARCGGLLQRIDAVVARLNSQYAL